MAGERGRGRGAAREITGGRGRGRKREIDRKREGERKREIPRAGIRTVCESLVLSLLRSLPPSLLPPSSLLPSRREGRGRIRGWGRRKRGAHSGECFTKYWYESLVLVV